MLKRSPEKITLRFYGVRIIVPFYEVVFSLFLRRREPHCHVFTLIFSACLSFISSLNSDGMTARSKTWQDCEKHAAGWIHLIV